MVIAQQKNLHRLPRGQKFTAIFPVWLLQAIKADLAQAFAHSQSTDWNSFDVTAEQVQNLFAARDINAVWHLDGQGAFVMQPHDTVCESVLHAPDAAARAVAPPTSRDRRSCPPGRRESGQPRACTTPHRL